MKKESYKAGAKKGISAEEEAEIQKKVELYKAKIKTLMEEGKNKKVEKGKKEWSQ